ncbi:MAG: cytochrome P450 [Dehalococcoidia bacterium]
MTQAEAQPQEFSIFDNPAIAANPYPVFAAMRANAPVVKMGPLGLWAVSRYDDVLRVLRDPETFSSEVSAAVLAGEPARPSMIFNDPPVHTRLRGLISKAFTPRMVELQRPAVQAYCDRLVNALCASEDADLVAGLAYPLPVMVIANMLGVGDGDMATFKRWSDAIIENIGTALFVGDDGAMDAINVEFDAYFKARLDKLRRDSEDNLLSGLVHAETEDGRLSEDDLLVICRLLLVAGNETTTGLIVNAVRVFSEFPHVVTDLRARPALIPAAIEEVLRYYAPFAATFRRASRDVEIAGVHVPKDDRVIVLMASANRDERQFERPDEFIIGRDPNRHVSFGMGIHYCLGAPLARMEAEIALRTLLPRITAVRIAGDTEPDALLRPGGPKALHVKLSLVKSSSTPGSRDNTRAG